MINDVLFVLLIAYAGGVVCIAATLAISLIRWKGEIGPFWTTTLVVLACTFFWPLLAAGMAYRSVVKLRKKCSNKCTCSDKKWIICGYCQDNN